METFLPKKNGWRPFPKPVNIKAGVRLASLSSVVMRLFNVAVVPPPDAQKRECDSPQQTVTHFKQRCFTSVLPGNQTWTFCLFYWRWIKDLPTKMNMRRSSCVPPSFCCCCPSSGISWRPPGQHQQHPQVAAVLQWMIACVLMQLPPFVTGSRVLDAVLKFLLCGSAVPWRSGKHPYFHRLQVGHTPPITSSQNTQT